MAPPIPTRSPAFYAAQREKLLQLAAQQTAKKRGLFSRLFGKKPTIPQRPAIPPRPKNYRPTLPPRKTPILRPVMTKPLPKPPLPPRPIMSRTGYK